MASLSNLKIPLRTQATASLELVDRHLPALSAIGILTHLVYLGVNTSSGIPDSLLLRVACVLWYGVFCFPSAWKALNAEKRKAAIYVLGMLFVLPFFCTYVFLQALIVAPNDPQILAPRQIQLGFATACVFILLPFPVTCVLGLSIATLFAYVSAIVAYGGMPLDTVISSLLILTPIWAFGALAAVYFRSNNVESREQTTARMVQAGNNIAHELRTPLLGIAARAKALELALSSSFDSKQLTGGTVQSTSDRSRIETITRAPRDILNQIKNMNALLDIFVANTTGPNTESKRRSESFRVSECVHEAVAAFPYPSSRLRDSVIVSVHEDFSVQGPKVYLRHIVFNLLKNSIEHGKKGEELAINIVVNSPTLTFRDNGIGVARKDVKSIFERFFTSNPASGLGIGLSFCRSAMRDLGGEICLDKYSNRGATFVMSFELEEARCI